MGASTSKPAHLKTKRAGGIDDAARAQIRADQAAREARSQKPGESEKDDVDFALASIARQRAQKSVAGPSFNAKEIFGQDQKYKDWQESLKSLKK